jgi:hypothetical protein
MVLGDSYKLLPNPGMKFTSRHMKLCGKAMYYVGRRHATLELLQCNTQAKGEFALPDGKLFFENAGF